MYYGIVIDGNSEIGVHISSGIGNLTCLRHLFRSTAVIAEIIFGKNCFPSHVRKVLLVTIYINTMTCMCV